jgi:Uma2 family endonuclease
MALSDQKTCNIADFERFLMHEANSDRLYELIDGVISEKNYYTDECSIIAARLLFALTEWARVSDSRLPGPSRTFRVPGNDYNARTPNISMIVNPDVPLSTERVMTYVPEFIAEIKTPDDTIDLLRDKAQFYLANGIKLVWLFLDKESLRSTALTSLRRCSRSTIRLRIPLCYQASPCP